jgi:hypothetical protein
MGRLADVGLALRDQASLSTLTEDVIKTSEIEGEQLNVESVRSSIARRLGVDIGALAEDGAIVARGVKDMTTWARRTYGRGGRLSSPGRSCRRPSAPAGRKAHHRSGRFRPRGPRCRASGAAASSWLTITLLAISVMSNSC